MSNATLALFVLFAVPTTVYADAFDDFTKKTPQIPAVSNPEVKDVAEPAAPPSLLRKGNNFETTRFPARFVYLNGVNISSVRNQVLEDVTVNIDANGNLQITAPQYEVSQDSSYHPLLPDELPHFPKDRLQPIEGFPQGRFSKEQAKPPPPPTVPSNPISSSVESELPPPLPMTAGPAEKPATEAKKDVSPVKSEPASTGTSTAR